MKPYLFPAREKVKRVVLSQWLHPQQLEVRGTGFFAVLDSAVMAAFLPGSGAEAGTEAGTGTKATGRRGRGQGR